MHTTSFCHCHCPFFHSCSLEITCAIGPFDYLGVHKVSRTVSDIMGYRLFNMFLEVSYQFWNGFVRKVERVSARRMDTRIVR